MKKLSLIAAIDANGLIGVDNKIPWSVPEDMSHFAGYTKGKGVIMGSSTFYSIGKPLENRTSIVISSNTKKFDAYMSKLFDLYESTGKDLPLVINAESLNDIFQANLDFLGDELVCIGGGKMYESLLPYATNLIITKLKIEATIPPNGKNLVYFPSFDENEWEITGSQNLVSSLGITTGEIIFLERKEKYSNVFSFRTKKNISIEEIYCSLNGLEANSYSFLETEYVEDGDSA